MIYLPKASKNLLLLEQQYRFPTANKIAMFLRAHHLTLRTSVTKIQLLASQLHQAQAQTPTQIRHVIVSAGLPLHSVYPALINCAEAGEMWIYQPSYAEKRTLRRLNWKV